MNKMQEWWNNLMVWMGVSEPGGEFEVVEDLLTDETFMKELYSKQEEILAEEGRYGQVAPGKVHPGDRHRRVVDELNLPGNVDWWIDEWEGPEGKGWALRAKVAQGPNTKILTITREGSQGWQEVEDVPIP